MFGFAREIKIAQDYNLFVFENVAVHGKIARRIDLKAVLVYAPILDLHYKFERINFEMMKLYLTFHFMNSTVLYDNGMVIFIL